MIHKTAIVADSAIIADDVTIGPWCDVGAEVEIASGTSIGSHCVLRGPTRIGRNNRIYSHNAIGSDSQDKKYHGEKTRLEIGDSNVIREFCTLNRGTIQGGGVTRVGNDNWIMAYCHIAHDCTVANSIIMANGASLAGHVEVADFATLGGFTLVHQFCRIGAYSFAAMGSVVVKDVPPYVMTSGNTAQPHGLNVEGLRRHGFNPEQIQWLKRAYKVVFRQGLTIENAVSLLDEMQQECKEVALLNRFIQASQRGIIR